MREGLHIDRTKIDKDLEAKDVAKKNQIWQHNESGEKFIVVRLNRKSIGLLPIDTEEVRSVDRWTTVKPYELKNKYKFLYTMVTA